MQNNFKIFFDTATVGMNRADKQQFKREVAEKTGKTIVIIDNWISGKTTPSELEQKAINVIFRKQIY